ncbi:MAG: hypothetical protein IPH58_11275 [Sphingobacteriales bacterium]|nr:hypothetical protein [Sphingobacteriales bacterium]
MLPFKADFKEVGYNYMNAPFLISNTNVTGGASIMYGTSNCTVKVKRINLTYVEDGVLWKKGEINELKEAVLKRDGTVRNNLKNVLIILDYNFNKMFQSLF